MNTRDGDCILCQIQSGLIPYEGIVQRDRFWTVLVSREQHTLGTMIILLNRHIVRMSDLYDHELIELKEIQRVMENRLDTHFAPDLYNYLQCGNSVEHLHFHLIPRYKAPRIFLGKEYKDRAYGDSVIETEVIAVSDKIRALREVMQS